MPRLRLLPRSLFGRLFATMLGIAFALLLVSAALLYRQSFALLDDEAGRNLEAMARRLMAEWNSRIREQTGGDLSSDLERLLSAGGTAAWINNVYWVEFRDHSPRFVASYSVKMPGETDLLPPSIEDVDDLIEDGMFALEEGRAFFPDPGMLNVARRCKIVLVPRLDRDGILSGVVGVEADLRYMELFGVIGRAAVSALLWAVPLCVVAAMFLAGSVSRRVGMLVTSLERIGRNEPPTSEPLGIFELDRLREGLCRLYERLSERETQLRNIHAERIRELALMGSAIAHEVRNPLSAIGMHLGLLKRKYLPEGADAEPFKEIQGQLEQLKILVDRFLGYSRDVKPVRERFRPADLLRDAISARVPTGGRVDIRCPEVEVEGDIMMWRQIAENLIDNAVSACYPKPVEMNIDIYRKNDMVCFSFADAGPGVPQELVPRLFTPFATGRPGGHGIGLALVRKFVEAHDGSIRYESAPGGGAAFLIEVPVRT
ncbi:MAG TPA: HAMP domain-containing sensor histidine kinase [Candidatus Ozemobacteraceae bacterium]|nr:HAMP domain-containing sensor histidine kinase [Candidatus Ozemobacteraceae bacterium]